MREERLGLETRHWLFILLALSIALISITKLRGLVDAQSEISQYYRPVRWWLLPHVVTGAMALLAGPCQFSKRLRRSRPILHRRIGYLYLVAVFASGPLGVVVSLLHVPLVPSLAPIMQASVWCTFTGMAWSMAVRRKFVQHSQWMVRSYAITTTFVSTRLLFSVPAIDGLSADGAAIIILCVVVLTSLLTEIGIQLQSPYMDNSARLGVFAATQQTASARQNR